jgi:hypothetical protein
MFHRVSSLGTNTSTSTRALQLGCFVILTTVPYSNLQLVFYHNRAKVVHRRRKKW